MLTTPFTPKVTRHDAVLHRRVVRVGAVAAWFVAALLIVGGVLSGDPRFFLEVLTPGLVASVFTLQILLGKEHAVFSAFFTIVAVVVVHTVIGPPETVSATAASLILAGGIGAMLVSEHRLAISGVTAVALFAAPHLWGYSVDEALAIGLTMGLGVLVLTIVLATVRSAAAEPDRRFLSLFEDAPSAVLQEDWSEAVEYVISEYSGRPERILPFLMAYPQVIRRAVSRVQVVRANQAALDLLEAEEAQLVGQRDGAKVPEDSLEAFAVALATLYLGETSFVSEFAAKTFTGRRIWLQCKGADVSPEGDHTTILVGLADVTHIKARQDAMAELVRTKDEFVGRVSHELRTPLTAVLGLTAEMSSAVDMSDGERLELTKLVADQAQEMSYLVEDLLVASQAEIGTVSVDSRPVDLHDEIRAAFEGIGMDASDLPTDMPLAVADPTRVRQILRNLLTNAQRYGSAPVEVASGTYFDRAWLEVRDHGLGVPDHLTAAIFEPYITAHRGVKGSVGLGLSVSRQLAELMGGTLSYQRDGGQSVFRLELPLDTETETKVLASQFANS